MLVPANRFEVLECRAAIEAVRDDTLDGEPPRIGGLDVLAQHILGMACAAPFAADELYAEVRRAAPYAGLPRQDFDDALAFVGTGGYALRSYDRLQRLSLGEDGLYHVANPRVARQYRLNVGTIVEEPMLKVRAAQRPPPGRGGGVLHPGARARRHLHLRRPDAAFRGRPRDHGCLYPSRRRGSEDARLCRRPPAADHAAC